MEKLIKDLAIQNANDCDPPYELDEIILTLEAIKEHGYGQMNPWKMALCLAKEIKELKEWKENGRT